MKAAFDDVLNQLGQAAPELDLGRLDFGQTRVFQNSIRNPTGRGTNSQAIGTKPEPPHRTIFSCTGETRAQCKCSPSVFDFIWLLGCIVWPGRELKNTYSIF